MRYLGGGHSRGDAEGGDGPEDRRLRRVEQLRRMSDAESADEARRHQQSRWRTPSLVEHAKRHARDFTEILGAPLTPTELDECSRVVLYSWSRLFTELERSGLVSYIFTYQVQGKDATLAVITRADLMRTAFPLRDVDLWWKRHLAAVEVTERARRLGLRGTRLRCDGCGADDI